MLPTNGRLKPFANVPRICSLGDIMRAEFLGERKHLFPDGVDKHHLRDIDDELQSDVTARDECTNLLSSLSGESALEPQIKESSNCCVPTRSMMSPSCTLSRLKLQPTVVFAAVVPPL